MSNYGKFPIVDGTIVITSAGASLPAALTAGILYQVTADAAAYLKYNEAAVTNEGLYLAPNKSYKFVFGAGGVGSETVNVIAGAGAHIYFTPLYPVSS